MDFLDLDLDFVYVAVAGRVLGGLNHGLDHHKVVDLLGLGIPEVKLTLAGRHRIGGDHHPGGVDPEVVVVLFDQFRHALANSPPHSPGDRPAGLHGSAQQR